MTRGVTIAISENTSHKPDPSSLLVVISNGNMLPKFDCAAFAQALKVNFENFRFAIAEEIFLRFVTDNSNQLQESFSSRDHTDNLRVASISNQIVLPIRRNVFFLV